MGKPNKQHISTVMDTAAFITGANKLCKGILYAIKKDCEYTDLGEFIAWWNDNYQIVESVTGVRCNQLETDICSTKDLLDCYCLITTTCMKMKGN